MLTNGRRSSNLTVRHTASQIRSVVCLVGNATAIATLVLLFGAGVAAAGDIRQAYNAIQYVDTRYATGQTIASSGSIFDDSFTTNVPQGAQMPFGMTHIHPVTNVRAEDPNTYSLLSGADAGTVYTSHDNNNDRRGSDGQVGRERWEYYSFERARLKAFALTAVSGTGCFGRIAKDFPFMLYPGDQSSKKMDVSTPTSANRADINSNEVRPLQVKDEDPTNNLVGEPGYFKAVFNETRTGGNNLIAEFTTSYRSGIARFDMSNMNEDTATLFFTTMSSMKRDDSDISVVTRDGKKVIEGKIVNLGFCGDDWSSYTVYMVAEFSVRPEVTVEDESPTSISWNGKQIALKLNGNSESLEEVLVKYGLSYVSLDAAYNNMQKEIPDWDFEAIKTAAQEAWNDHLGVVRIQDSEPTNADEKAALLDRKKVFYGALYRASLGPNLFSDLPFDSDEVSTPYVDESRAFYIGFNDDIYNVESHQNAQYQNFSGWDTYRSQSQLVSLLYRETSSDMAQSLVNNARQSNCSTGSRNCEDGSFTQWGIANDDANVMSGEPGAIIVANAFLLGAANFDVQEAFEAMQRGNDDVFGSGGPYYSNNTANRPKHRYTTDRNGSPLNGNQSNNGTSKWAELASAMFAKAVFSKFLAKLKLQDEGTFYGLAEGNFGSINGLVTRLKWFLEDQDDTYATAAGEFFADYTDCLSKFRDEFGTSRTNTSTTGLQEGTVGQYLWSLPTNLNSVPSDHHETIELWYTYDSLADPREIPEDASTSTRRFIRALSALDDHLDLGHLNAGYVSRHMWFGNQVSHFAPWAYNFLSESTYAEDSWRTQRVVRTIFHDMFNASIDDGMAGNDDMGSLSAWGVWSALGLYPAVPGLPIFTLVNPVFRKIEIDKDEVGGGLLTIESPDVDYTTDMGTASGRRFQYISDIQLKKGSGSFQQHGKSYISFKDLFTPEDLSQNVVLRINVVTETEETSGGEGVSRTEAPTGVSTTLAKGPSISTEAELDEFIQEILGVSLSDDAPLTAAFEDMPATHDGATEFAFRVRFSEDIRNSIAGMRDRAFDVTGGSVVKASRVKGDKKYWEIKIQPDGDDDVVIVLAANRGCGSGPCTKDRRRLAKRLEETVKGSASTQPEASITANSATVAEGTSASFTVTLGEAPTEAVTVAVSVAETDAMLAETAPTSVEIAAGATSATLAVTTDDDKVVEGNSTVTATLSSATGYTVGADDSAEVVVTDNDTATFAVVAKPEEIAEGERATVTVSVADGVTFASDQTIALSASGTASSSDFTLTPTSRTLTAGQSSVTATVTATDDPEAEQAETVVVTARHDGASVGSTT